MGLTDAHRTALQREDLVNIEDFADFKEKEIKVAIKNARTGVPTVPGFLLVPPTAAVPAVPARPTVPAVPAQAVIPEVPAVPEEKDRRGNIIQEAVPAVPAVPA